MKCEYCGAKYVKSKYSECCRSCYGPAPKKPKPYEISHNIKELKITQSSAAIMVGAGGGGGSGMAVSLSGVGGSGKSGTGCGGTK